MRGPVFVSTTLHIAVVAVLYFGVPHWANREPPPEEHPIVVDLVTVADLAAGRLPAELFVPTAVGARR